MNLKTRNKLVVIDSCEYIIRRESWDRGCAGFFAHKGNCRYCKKHREKEMNELVKYLKNK